MMTVLAAAAAYLAGAYHLARMAWAPEYARGPGLLMGTIGALIHLAVHADTWRLSGGPDLSFLSALSWVALGMAALTLLASHRQRLEALGVVVFPLAALALLGHSLDSAGTTSTERLDWGIELHALLALLAYATLALAALLAIMLWLQERALRQRRFTTALRALPPLTQLEMLLFRTLAAAFAVLTLALITGLTFVKGYPAAHPRNPTRSSEFKLQPETKHRMLVEVGVRGQNGDISVTIDGKTLVRWSGPLTDLSLFGQEWLPIAPHPSTQGFGLFPVQSARLQMLDGQAVLLEPDGPGRTAYLLTGNYRAILDYNCSNFYALSVGLLADEITR